MDAEADICTRCGANAVAYDHEGSCYVCQSCGYVLPQHGLVPYQDVADHQQANPVGGHLAVTSAYTIEAGQSTGAALPLGSFGVGLEAAARCVSGGADHSRARRQRRALDDLQGLAATLRLPGPTTQLAAGFLARIHQAVVQSAAARQDGGSSGGLKAGAAAEAADGDEGASFGDVWGSDGDGDDAGASDAAVAAAGAAASAGPAPAPPPPTGGQQSAARLGALLYLAARSERGTLTLAEVAMATGTDMYRVGEMARRQASFLQLSLPAVDVERFVLRIARELVASGQLQQPAREGPAAADRADGGGSVSAAAPVSETAVWSHPLVRRALQLTGLVVRKGWHEGRTPRTVAGALLSICLDSLYPQRGAAGAGGGGTSLTVTQLSRAAMCAESQLWDLKQEVVGRLLRLASGLPFGPLVGPSNVASYLDVIIAADEVVGGMQLQPQ